jgi:hypothetical protein
MTSSVENLTLRCCCCCCCCCCGFIVIVAIIVVVIVVAAVCYVPRIILPLFVHKIDIPTLSSAQYRLVGSVVIHSKKIQRKNRRPIFKRFPRWAIAKKSESVATQAYGPARFIPKHTVRETWECSMTPRTLEIVYICCIV